MTDYTRQYRRTLSKRLPRPNCIRKSLLKQFDSWLANFLADTPSPTADQLYEAFGAPTDVAKLMFEKLSDSQKARCKQTQRNVQILCSILVLLFIAFVIYVYCFQDKAIISVLIP